MIYALLVTTIFAVLIGSLASTKLRLESFWSVLLANFVLTFVLLAVVSWWLQRPVQDVLRTAAVGGVIVALVVSTVHYIDRTVLTPRLRRLDQDRARQSRP